MNERLFSTAFQKELEAESVASRKCLERIPESLFNWKPHEKSMTMGYLALLVAEIPKWIYYMVEKSELDLVTFEHFKPQSTAELVKHFDENIDLAEASLKKSTDEKLSEPFYLKANGQIVFTSPKKDNIGSSINHLVHHRGQLTVYMRLNNTPVPSIYGPSADDKPF